ncbi:MAG: hypothetical protein HY361_03835 [Candidatus Aenigmarchaeota archaeon]|nr:hypothetical protein [Candidatus Aenigmarchaeota archaeon]
MQVKLQIFLLAAAVVLAGCIGQPTTTGGGGTAGLIITSFSPELPEVEGGENVVFTMAVKNVGDVSVATSAAKIQILGLDDWAVPSGSPGKTVTIDTDLRRADPARGEEGEEFFKDTTLTAPQKDTTITYTPTVRVLYPYTTTSTILLKFATREVIKTDPNQQSTATIATTSGPFVVSVRGKLLTIKSGSNVEVPFQLEIQNVGGGRAFSGTGVDAASDEIDKIKVTPTGSGATITCDPSGADVRLIGGKSRVLSCRATFSTVPPATITATLDLELEYNYFIDTQTSVTLLKTSV